MIEPMLMNEISVALKNYQSAISRTIDTQEKEDYLRLVFITQKLISSMKIDDTAAIKLNILSFSRQVSDSLSTQPPEFKELGQKIATLRKNIL